MPKHYVYRMKRDTGFAPHIQGGMCTLSGCKKTTVEVRAEPGTWVIGIGGNKTGKPDRLVYALEVEENLPYSEFGKRYPQESQYLHPERAGRRVLVSRRFYCFGHRAIPLPKDLRHLVVKTQGCKLVSSDEVVRLEHFLSERYDCGRLGTPNNPDRGLCGRGKPQAGYTPSRAGSRKC